MTTQQPKVALITGVTGQDGSYFAEFLLEKGYEVHCIKRHALLKRYGFDVPMSAENKFFF